MISQELIDSIKKHEGHVTVLGTHRMYLDSVKVPTIGYGHNMNEGISESIAQALLIEDLGTAIHEVSSYVDTETLTDLYGPRLDVLYEMAFNMGMPRLKLFKKMWLAVFERNWEWAAEEMLDSKWAVQVGQRANTLADKMREG